MPPSLPPSLPSLLLVLPSSSLRRCRSVRAGLLVGVAHRALTVTSPSRASPIAAAAAAAAAAAPRSAFMAAFLKDRVPPAPMGPVASALREKLAVAFDPLVLDIIDDSSKHAGHAAMKGLKPVETHFRVTIVAEAFKDRKLVQRHRMVYDAVDAELKAGVHALSITARTPDEAAAKQAAADAAAAS